MQPEALYVASSNHQNLLSPGMLIGVLFIAAVSVFVLIKPSIARRGDEIIVRSVATLTMFICLSTIFVVAYQTFKISHLSSQSGATAIIDGCVSNFRREFHPNEHNLVDTYFKIGSNSFHFNSSPWFSGFHNEDDIIKLGDHLQIRKAGDDITEISRLPGPCK